MRAPRRLVVGWLVVALASVSLAACATGGASHERTIEVDYRYDEFAGSFNAFFPRTVTVEPGATLRFHQNWSGSPHTVTLGTQVTELAAPILGLVHDHAAGRALPDPLPPAYQAFSDALPDVFRGANGSLSQTAAQPCFLAAGASIPAADATCPRVAQPSFDGSASYYSSGVIPFEGSGSNRFALKIASNTAPGTYFYYCSIHGPFMSGEVTVSSTAKPDTQRAISARGRQEATALAKPLLAAYKAELTGTGRYKGNLAGSGGEAPTVTQGHVNEFTPRRITTNVGTPVTWTFIGSHSISFNVPRFAPLFKIQADGTVVADRILRDPAGGWPGRTPAVTDPSERVAPAPAHIDAGTWDGSGGLHSSGVNWVSGDTYTVTFSKKGTYPFACLIHQGMIGKVVVT